MKYDTDGTGVWTNRYSSLGSYADRATALAVDVMGNVYVTGFAYFGSGFGNDYATLKYDSNGVAVWTNRYNGPNSTDQATAIAVDSVGNVYVTGYSYGGSASGYDYATVKYGANGIAVWTNRYSSPGSYADRATALAVDTLGNVYVTGYSHGTGDDYTTLKYDSNGFAVWTNRYNGPNSTDQATALAVDGAGNVYVTGYSYGGSARGYDYATVKYDGNGAQKWVARTGGNSSSVDKAYALTLDNAGSIYVAGQVGNDYGVVKYVQTAMYSACTNSSSGGIRPGGIRPLDGGDGGSEEIAPFIIGDPESQVILVGSDANFIIGVDGSQPFTYQWRFNSTNISGANALEYMVTRARPEDAGDYSVVVGNTSGSVTSAVARLTVLTSWPAIKPPQISANGEFTFILSGDPGYNYIIEVSTDLLDWTPVTTLTNATGQVQFIDPIPTDSEARFYRAILAP